jgi:hypothetical protein
MCLEQIGSNQFGDIQPSVQPQQQYHSVISSEVACGNEVMACLQRVCLDGSVYRMHMHDKLSSPRRFNSQLPRQIPREEAICFTTSYQPTLKYRKLARVVHTRECRFRLQLLSDYSSRREPISTARCRFKYVTNVTL